MFKATDAAATVISIVVILLLIVLCFLLFRLIKHNYKKNQEESEILTEDLVTKTAFNKLFDNHIQRVGSFGSFTLFMVSLDEYTSLKDTIGKEGLEDILTEYTNRLTHYFSHSCLITRSSEDEFLILNKNELKYEELDDIANDVLELLHDPFLIYSKEEIRVTSSMGIALYPSCGQSVKELMQSVTLANYISKRDGGNRYTIYTSDMSQDETENLKYFQEVRRAIDNHEFLLYYQPMINMRERKVYGFESFLRWNHPAQGLIAPVKFLSILEQSGDINYVSKWGLEQLLIEIKSLDQDFPKNDIKFSINLSTKQLMNDSIADEYRRLLHKYKVDPRKIILEIGNYEMSKSIEEIRINLIRLRDLGFFISVDGLKLDSSSLATLEKTPINIIKLNKDFLLDTENNLMQEKLVSMLVESSSNLNRVVISEGIETKDNAKYVLDNEVLFGQGYYFAKPFPQESIAQFIREKSWYDALEFEKK